MSTSLSLKITAIISLALILFFIISTPVKKDIHIFQTTQSATPFTRADKPESVARNTKVETKTSVQTDIFGTLATKKPSKSSDDRVSNLPKTRLKLVLSGTFTNIVPEQASALVANSKHDSVRYYVGQELPGGAKLVAVLTDSIILRRNGKNEVLHFPRISSSASGDDKPAFQQSGNLAQPAGHPTGQQRVSKEPQPSESLKEQLKKRLNERLKKLSNNNST